MFIVAARAEIYIEWSFSLKNKRKVRYSLSSKLKREFNISVKEIDRQDSKKHLVLGIASVQRSESKAENFLHKIENFIMENTDAQLEGFVYDIIKF